MNIDVDREKEKFNLEPEISAVVLLRCASCPSTRRGASSRNHRAVEYLKSILAANGKQGVGGRSEPRHRREELLKNGRAAPWRELVRGEVGGG
jgi:hypothetical protein